MIWRGVIWVVVILPLVVVWVGSGRAERKYVDVTSNQTVHLGVANAGNCLHLKNFCKVSQIVVIGGSVPAGHQCRQEKNVPDKKCSWAGKLQGELKNRSANCTPVVVNRAAGGAGSGSAVFIAQNDLATRNRAGVADWSVLYILSTSTNDENVQKFFGLSTSDPDTSPVKAAFETLVRVILAAKQRLVIFTDFNRMVEKSVADEVHRTVAELYDVPMFSAREAFWWDHLRYGDPGLNTKTVHPKEVWHAEFAAFLAERFLAADQRRCPRKAVIPPLPDHPYFADGRCVSPKAFASVMAPQEGPEDGERAGRVERLGERLAFNPDSNMLYGPWEYASTPDSKFGWECPASEECKLNVNTTLSPIGVAKRTAIYRVSILYLRTHWAGWGDATFHANCGGRVRMGASHFLRSKWGDDSSQIAASSVVLSCRGSKNEELPLTASVDMEDSMRFRIVGIEVETCNV